MRGPHSEIHWILERSKASPVGQVFGDLAVVQRCQHHKRVNVREHLPQKLRPGVDRALSQAWLSANASLAQRQLERLASSLELDHPGAAASLPKGLAETLALQTTGHRRCAVPDAAHDQPIENLNGSIGNYTHNVKRWRGAR